MEIQQCTCCLKLHQKNPCNDLTFSSDEQAGSGMALVGEVVEWSQHSNVLCCQTWMPLEVALFAFSQVTSGRLLYCCSVAKQNAINILIPVILLLLHQLQEGMLNCLVKLLDQAVCLRMVGSRDPMLCLCQCKQVLAHTVDEFTPLVTDDNVGTSKPN